MTSNFKIRGKCFGCKRKRWFIKTRKIVLPMGLVAQNRDLVCNECYKNLNREIKKNHVKTKDRI